MTVATKIKVRLLQPHTHAGAEYKKDDELELSPEKANWLIAAGRAEKAVTPPTRVSRVEKN